mmetsp:Transcript_921/g.3724  ORF Transcript_921/g.3724 Transcript_921/m.3724 type:complete len:438 (-) Transcript_921:390-1703(-)
MLQGVGLEWGVLRRVHALHLRFLVAPQQACHTQGHEDERGHATRPEQDHDDLHDIRRERLAESSLSAAVSRIVLATAPAVPAVVVVNTCAPIKEGSREDTPGAASTMHRGGVDGVVDLDFDQQGGGALVEEGADDADEHGRSTLDVAAARRDGDQAGEDAVAHAADVVPPVHDVAQDEDDQAPGRARERRVHGHLGRQGALRRGGHPESGTAVESVPTEPQDESAQDDQRQAVRGERLANVAVEAAVARADHCGANERADAAAHVDDAAAGEVHEAGLVDVVVSAARQPAIAPSPVHHHRVDKRAHDDGKDRIAHKLHTLGNAAADDGGGRGAEGPLKEPIYHDVRRCKLTVFIHFGEAMAEELGVVRKGVVVVGADAVREAPTECPPTQRADAHVQQVFHQNVLHVLGAAATGLDHGEAGLHEHHEGPAEDEPSVV